MTAMVTVVAVLVLAWFAAGTILNLRKGSALLRWMQAGLPLLGERTTVRWLGTSAVEMVIREARRPFEQATVVIFLEPRDVPWIWALSRSRGRRDTLIVRGRLSSAPRADLEVLERQSWSGRDAQRGLARSEWSVREPAPPGGPAAYYKVSSALSLADSLAEQARKAGLHPFRLSVRRIDPHFQIHVPIPGAEVSARDFFEAVRALGERAAS